jgi:hypothetical protein
MKKISFLIAFLLLFNSPLFSQVSISNDNSAPDSSAMFDVKSTNKGFLLPRITRSQRNAIVTPANGLMVFCTNCGTNGSLSIFTNGSWLTFSPCAIAPPVAGSHFMSPGKITWNWNAVPDATGYKWSTTPDDETATDMGAGLSKTETGTICNNTYTRYIWAYRSCGESEMTTLTQTIPPIPPASPTPGTHTIDLTNIVWNWNTVPGATGYKWNMVDDYASAIEMGTATTKTETGLTCGTAYTRYVWAYNGCGYSLVTILNQSTWQCLAIGVAYGGGIIFYLDGTGQHGLISATTDQYVTDGWGCEGITIGTSTAIGTGQANTTLIVNGCSTPGIAARICDDLVLNGYSDWFLPSKAELNLMYLQKTVIGGFNYSYWSSSESGANDAWVQQFYSGGQYITFKNDWGNVRAIRAF